MGSNLAKVWFCRIRTRWACTTSAPVCDSTVLEDNFLQLLQRHVRMRAKRSVNRGKFWLSSQGGRQNQFGKEFFLCFRTSDVSRVSGLLRSFAKLFAKQGADFRTTLSPFREHSVCSGSQLMCVRVPEARFFVTRDSAPPRFLLARTYLVETVPGYLGPGSDGASREKRLFNTLLP